MNFWAYLVDADLELFLYEQYPISIVEDPLSLCMTTSEEEERHEGDALIIPLSLGEV